jgi:hypothetical protein
MRLAKNAQEKGPQREKIWHLCSNRAGRASRLVHPPRSASRLLEAPIPSASDLSIRANMFGQRKPAVNRKVALVELGKSALIFLGVVAGTPPFIFTHHNQDHKNHISSSAHAIFRWIHWSSDFFGEENHTSLIKSKSFKFIRFHHCCLADMLSVACTFQLQHSSWLQLSLSPSRPRQAPNKSFACGMQRCGMLSMVLIDVYTRWVPFMQDVNPTCQRFAVVRSSASDSVPQSLVYEFYIMTQAGLPECWNTSKLPSRRFRNVNWLAVCRRLGVRVRSCQIFQCGLQVVIIGRRNGRRFLVIGGISGANRARIRARGRSDCVAGNLKRGKK